ncbi:MAG TPA: MFS transporter [Bryobacteraceae bacterium]|nr:MFS transporter [Bryobacteraceae bacterium]
MARPLTPFLALHSAGELASQMLNVAIGWHLYSLTHSPMSLAYAGLAQFLPNAATALLAGHAADRWERRNLIAWSAAAQAACVAAFALWTIPAPPSALPVYLLLFLLGTARAFGSPAMSAILPAIVSAEEFPRAVAASTSAFQICAIAGPALGGLLYAFAGRMVFAAAAALYLFGLTQAWRLPAAGRAEPAADEGLLAGVRYVGANRLLLALLSLDLFAVLLGGVTALLPIYARDILAVGPVGLGCLRCAPGIGAAAVGLLLSRRSAGQGAARSMLACVAGFGVATAVFALSTSFWLSLAALAGAGGFDMVSMVIRHTLVQTATPDAMRGRVSAINWIFIGASAELGEFESGAAAALFGTVPAALLGGLGTLAVVGLWTMLFPELSEKSRHADQTT